MMPKRKCAKMKKQQYAGGIHDHSALYCKQCPGRVPNAEHHVCKEGDGGRRVRKAKQIRKVVKRHGLPPASRVTYVVCAASCPSRELLAQILTSRRP